MLARYGKQKQPRKMLPKISQEMLAEIIGTTRPRVNVFMNKFRKLGFIKYNGEIQINDSLSALSCTSNGQATSSTVRVAGKFRIRAAHFGIKKDGKRHLRSGVRRSTFDVST
jgi:hypothetical protein